MTAAWTALGVVMAKVSKEGQMEYLQVGSEG